MKIFVTGSRGVPDIPGGVEKHCQELYPLISAQGHDVFISIRKSYANTHKYFWNSIKLVPVPAPRIKSIEALIHTFLSIIKAKHLGADILHIHSIGPGLLVPFAKSLGLVVVLTNHGPDYDRQKWGAFARLILKAGEYLGCRFADNVIAISPLISQIIFKRCNVHSEIIFNGVAIPSKTKSMTYLDKINVLPKKYFLAVGRFVPEKGIDLLIDAFKMINQTHLKLVIVGDADHPSAYSNRLKETIDKEPNIVRTGYITGDSLNQIFSHALLFVMPSYHEGLPIVLLEAMAYELPFIISDIPATRELNLPKYNYFKSGSSNELHNRIIDFISSNKCDSDVERENNRARLDRDYSWPSIAEKTVGVYQKSLSNSRKV